MTRYNFRFEVAVLVSLLLHVALVGGWEHRVALARLPLFRPLARLAAALRPARPATIARATPVMPVEPTISFVPAPEPARPKQFIETDARQVTGEKPAQANYYSDNATVAANPANPTGKTGDTPYLDGKPTPVPSTVTVLPGSGAGGPVRSPVTAPAPAPPPAPVAARPAAPAAKPVAAKPPAPVEKPKTVADAGVRIQEEPSKALAQAPAAMSAGPPPRAMVPATPPAPPAAPAAAAGSGSKREIAAQKARAVTAGTAKIGVAAFNVAESPFGAYDKMIVRAVQSRWYALIEQNGLYERAGQVTLHFQLLDDGTVQAMAVQENSAGQILALFCEKAVVESAPFEPLPDNLRVLVGKEPREVNFTFYY